MRKISLLLAITLLLVAGSVDAQKKGQIQPPVPAGSYLIQDDNGDGYMIIDANTGAFKCVICEYGVSWTGKGTVKFDALSVAFNAETRDYRMFVLIDVFTHQGKAVIEIYNGPGGRTDLGPFNEYWTDANMLDSKVSCNAFTTQ